jgi:hypothetical protein
MRNKSFFSIIIILMIIMINISSCKKIDPIVDDVVVTPSSENVSRGASIQLNAVISSSKRISQEVIWTVHGGNTRTNINSRGLLTISVCEPASTLTVRATSTIDNTKFDESTINVEGALITDLSINPKNVDIVIGSTKEFIATVTGINNPPQTVLWSVTGNNSTSTYIDSKGLLKVATDENSSQLTVRASSTYDINKKDEALINVTEPSNDVHNAQTWIEVINQIRNGGNNKNYRINICNNFSATVTPGSELTFGSVANLLVIIEGDHVIEPQGTGSLLRIGANQTVIIRNLKMIGLSENNAPLVVVAPRGTFIMEDNASISGNINTSQDGAGGVEVRTGTFIMRGNSAVEQNSGKSAVFISNKGMFTMMNDAKILRNRGNYAGGVFIDDSSFIMQDNATVSYNTGLFSVISVGGVYLAANSSSKSSSFVMQGNALVSSNTGSTGGVRLELNCHLSMSDYASISTNRGGGLFGSDRDRYNNAQPARLEMRDNTSITKNIGGHSRLHPGTGGVEIYTLIMRNNASVNRNTGGNGRIGGIGGLSVRRLEMHDNASVFENIGGDGAGIGGETVFGGKGGIQVRDFIMYGGSISKNISKRDGGGVSLINAGYSGPGGTFTLHNGVISDNKARTNGGGIYIYQGTFIMSGGVISGNSAEQNGGGVFARWATFTKTGGTIYGHDEPDIVLKNTAKRGHSIFQESPVLWRNSTANQNMNSSSFGFWLND